MDGGTNPILYSGGRAAGRDGTQDISQVCKQFRLGHGIFLHLILLLTYIAILVGIIGHIWTRNSTQIPIWAPEPMVARPPPHIGRAPKGPVPWLVARPIPALASTGVDQLLQYGRGGRPGSAGRFWLAGRLGAPEDVARGKLKLGHRKQKLYGKNNQPNYLCQLGPGSLYHFQYGYTVTVYTLLHKYPTPRGEGFVAQGVSVCSMGVCV